MRSMHFGIIAMFAGITAAVAAQQPAAPAPAPDAAAQVTACSQVQPGITARIDGSLALLEEARQTNSAAAMRAVSDELRAVLLDVRAQLAPCSGMQPATADPHAGHVTPAAAVQEPASAPAVAAANPAGSAAAVPAAQAPAQRPATPAQRPAAAQPAQNAAPSVTFRTTPNPPRGAASNQFEVTVRDGQRPVADAEVLLQLFMAAMPAMKMPEMRSEVKLTPAGNGRYTGTGQVMMAGAWEVTIVVRRGGRQIAQQRVNMTAR